MGKRQMQALLGPILLIMKFRRSVTQSFRASGTGRVLYQLRDVFLSKLERRRQSLNQKFLRTFLKAQWRSRKE